VAEFANILNRIIRGDVFTKPYAALVSRLLVEKGFSRLGIVM
jgi:hypothetical protein